MSARSEGALATERSSGIGDIAKAVRTYLDHLTVERGGERLSFTMPVSDLHWITPDEYIEYGDGVFHNLSYQQARHFYRPVSGVYVANPGYVFGKAAIPRGSIVTGIGSDAVATLDDFQRALEVVPDDQQVPVRFVTFAVSPSGGVN